MKAVKLELEFSCSFLPLMLSAMEEEYAVQGIVHREEFPAGFSLHLAAERQRTKDWRR